MRPILLILLWCCPLPGQLTPDQTQRNVASFEKIWTTIRDKHWDDSFASNGWVEVHDEYLPQVEFAKTMGEARAAMSKLIEKVHLTHFALMPSDFYDTLNSPGQRGADLEDRFGPEGDPGMDTRVVDGSILVTKVHSASPAAQKGVKAGWEVLAVDGEPVGPVVAKIAAELRQSTLQQLMMSRAVERRLTGKLSKPARIRFRIENGRETEIEIPRAAERGASSQFGNLPPIHVWYESRKIGQTGYFAFNVFLDPQRVISAFEESVRKCAACDGFIVDLRGNPGGIGLMAMGMAGFFIDQPDQRLGTMKMRSLSLNFVINPRLPAFRGPLAVLVDGLSASTSEIFAGGLQDLHRARIFGTRTAGAALPSMIERLPNGDAFQYAVANYVSEGGATLEGHGVVPDVTVPYERSALLQGRDAALDAAVAWIHSLKEKHD